MIMIFALLLYKGTNIYSNKSPVPLIDIGLSTFYWIKHRSPFDGLLFGFFVTCTSKIIHTTIGKTKNHLSNN